MKSKEVWVFRIVTGLFTLLMGFSASMYFAQHEMVVAKFTVLGFPSWIIYPLAIAKLLGLVAIWTNKSKMLKEWAYAGFVFELMLAIGAHVSIGDGEQWAAVAGLVMVVISYVFHRKIYTTYAA